MPKRKKIIKSVENWFIHFERPLSSFSVIAGFVFNALFLTRADLFWENFWIAIHILIAAVCIVFINIGHARNERLEIDEKEDPNTLHFWLVSITQFMFGGLMSTFIVFYFRSGVLSVAWPFFLMLAVAFIANERLKKRYERTTFQIIFLFLSILLFAIYFVPVLTKEIGPRIFVLSGLIALALTFLFLLILRLSAKNQFRAHQLSIVKWIAGIFVGVNTLYFFGLIPPLPLSAEDSGIYHSITRTSDGDYSVSTELPQTLFEKAFSSLGITTRYTSELNAPVYAYTAIFSPVSFSTSIVHQWQHYDEQSRQWVTSGTVTLPILGGRDGGYRTYSIHRITDAGKWRVNVSTGTGQLLDRIHFTAVIQDKNPETVTIIKQ